MSITQERKAELITEFGKNNQDSGSASVQVAILSERIRNLIRLRMRSDKIAT